MNYKIIFNLCLRLIDFLKNDEKELFDEVHVETAEERLQKNREKVKVLKEKHEKERLEEVEKKRDQQFRYFLFIY